MKITIYELLGLFKDGKEVPKKFKYDNLVFELDKSGMYIDEDGDYLTASICNDFSNLDNEIEILDEEEEFIDIEEIVLNNDGRIISSYADATHYVTTNIKDREIYIKLINQIIKNQKLIINKLKEEGK